MNPERLPVREIVRLRREELGMSTGDLARALGIRSPEYIALLEAGHVVIQVNRAPAFAAALRLDVVEFCMCCLFEASPLFYQAAFGGGAPAPPSPR